MKRKAEEEQPKEKKQNTLVKFKRPGAYFCVVQFSFYAIPYKPPEIAWRWLTHFGSNPGGYFDWHLLTAHRNNVPASWVFRDEIEPVAFDVYFGGTLRGLARIVAEYAELDRESMALVHLCNGLNITHSSQMRIVGEGWPQTIHQWQDVLNAVKGRCNIGIGNMCHVTKVPFTIPRPTTENVI